MLHNAAFYQGLHRLLRQKQSSDKEILFYLEIITCDPSMYDGLLYRGTYMLMGQGKYTKLICV